jgi:hypothetical protein
VESRVPSVRPEDFFVPLVELQAVGAKARAKPDASGRDPLGRFLAVPNHAMFLFTSEDVILDAYIRDHWAALDGLSGEICDIYVSLTQLQGLEDAYSQLNDVRSIRGLAEISPAVLPALHIWSAAADLTFSLKDVDSDLDKLRDALRNVFASMHSLGGPISATWVTQMRAWSVSLGKQRISGNGQSISNGVAGRDIIQITNFYTAAPNIGGRTMSTPPTRQTVPPKGQSIEDVVAGGNISQSSESESDTQAIRRARAPGDISQTKRKTAEMKFMGSSAGGWGIVGLVIVILAWIAYQYFASRA